MKGAAVAALLSLHPAPPVNLPPLPALTAADRVLVVAAHNDDEVLGAGGYMASALAAGAEVTAVIMTNGDANRWCAFRLTDHPLLRPKDMLKEGSIREAESRRALSVVGLPLDHLLLLGFPDQGLLPILSKPALYDHPLRSRFTHAGSVPYQDSYDPGTPYTHAAIVGELTDILAKTRPTIVVTHCLYDTHPDHRATHDFVREAMARWQDGRTGNVNVYTFLIHWPGFPKNRPEDARWRDFPLTPEAEGAKRGAVRSYSSQYLSPTLKSLMEKLILPDELFLAE